MKLVEEKCAITYLKKNQNYDFQLADIQTGKILNYISSTVNAIAINKHQAPSTKQNTIATA